MSKAGGGYRYPIIEASLWRNEAIMSTLLASGADINAEDSIGRRPAHMVFVESRGLDSTKNFIPWSLMRRYNTDFSKPDKLGRMPLHYAAAITTWVTDFESLLEKSKADINARDCDGWTPLMWACQNTCTPIATCVIGALVDEGADMWVTAEAGGERWSPLKLWRFHGEDVGDDDIVMLEPIGRTRQTGETNGGGSGSGAHNDVAQEWDDEFHEE